ncbi:MAG TPA: cupin domain-containing protein [Opitutaceae bacterium]|nr:cupin domain-containing protein [Opitutaceae bacterium]
MNTSRSLALAACALLGLARFAAAADAPPTEVKQFDHSRLESTFKTGAPGALEVNSLYKVMVSRRVAPGAGEIHARDTDIFYIVDGSATFVTGGKAVDVTALKQPDGSPSAIEFHFKSAEGGTEHHLQKGDSIIVPKGTPHQFTKIDGPFLYFVVKVTE